MSISWDAAPDDLDPVFRADVTALLGNDAASWIVTSGLRTFQQQADDYASGRTRPGDIITAAQPGRSAHNWGLAVDICRVQDGARLWDYAHPAWIRLRQFVDASPRLHGGWHFPVPDNDHIEAVPAWYVKKDSLKANGQWESIPEQYGL